MGLFTAAVFAQGVYAPSIIAGRQLLMYESSIANMTYQGISQVNATLISLQNTSRSGSLPNLPFASTATPGSYDYPSIMSQLQRIRSGVDSIYPYKLTATSGNQSVQPTVFLGLYSQVMDLISQIAVYKLGQYNASGTTTNGGPFNFTQAVQICTNDSVVPGTIPCQPVRLPQPAYYDTKHRQAYNFSLAFWD